MQADILVKVFGFTRSCLNLKSTVLVESLLLIMHFLRSENAAVHAGSYPQVHNFARASCLFSATSLSSRHFRNNLSI